MDKPVLAYIGLGSNLGDREGFINSALKMLAETEYIQDVRQSDMIENAPLGGADQPIYLNAVAETKTTLSAQDLHKRLTEIESSFGRTRQEKWSPRTIDLDILLFGEEIISRPKLTVPHAQMHLRSFVLRGLCQLNAELLHPVIKESMSELAGRLNGADFVLNPNLPQLISIAGIIGVGKTTLTDKLADVLGCQTLLEPYKENPFLPEVYAGKKELALDSQLFFLTERSDQVNPDTLVRGQIAITDYVFDKELIYARRLLNTEQLSLYQKIYPASRAGIAAPVLVMYMTDSAKNCLERIHRRNRPYEQEIEKRFLEDLSCDYEQLFADWKLSPVIRISMSEFDCGKDSDVNHLANQIRYYTAE